MTEKQFQQRKNDGKRRLATLCGLGVMEAVANASEVGLVKYWADGYREDGGYSYSQCLDSAVRHLMARAGGQKYDTDGSAYLGRPIDHLDMAAWNIAAACEARRLYGDQNDDLWKGPGTVVKGQQIPADEAERLALTDLAKRVRAFVSVMKPEHREAADALVKKLDEQTALVAAKKE